MSLNIKIKSTRLERQTDFYGLVDSYAVADHDKTYLMYDDGTRELVAIYSSEEVNDAVIQLDDVVGVEFGDAFNSITTSVIASFPNLEYVRLGPNVKLGQDGLFAACSALKHIKFDSYLMEEVLASEQELNEDDGSMFVDASSTEPRSIFVICNDGYLNIEYSPDDGIQPKDVTTTVQFADGSRGRLHHNMETKTFNLSSALIESGYTQKNADVTAIVLNNEVSALSSVMNKKYAYENYDVTGAMQNSKIKTIGFLSNLVEIPWYAFKDNKSLVSVDIPPCISAIGRSAFYGCESLESAIVPSSLAFNDLFYYVNGIHCDSDLFQECKKLKYLELNGITKSQLTSNVTQLPDRNLLLFDGYQARQSMFEGRDGNTFVKLSNDECVIVKNTCHPLFPNEPNSYKMFDVIPNLETQFIRYANEPGTSNFKKLMSGPLSKDDVANAGNLKEVVIGYGVTSVGDECFEDESHLSSVTTIGEACARYGKRAFAGCSNLESIDGEATISSIGEACFKNCSSLTSMNLSNVMTIPNEAFYGCASMDRSSLYDIAMNATSFGTNCFDGCVNLSLADLIQGGFFSNKTKQQVISLLRDTKIFGKLENNPIMFRHLENWDPDSQRTITLSVSNNETVNIEYNTQYVLTSIYWNGQWVNAQVQTGSYSIS